MIRYNAGVFSITVLIVVVMASTLMAPSTFAAERVVLQLKWRTQFQFAGYYVALAKGFYAAEGLDVDIRERAPKVNPLMEVLDGRADFGIIDSSLVVSRLRGRPVVLLAVILQHSPLVLISRKESGISAPRDLKGRSLMWWDEVDDAVLLAMLRADGLDSTDVIQVPHSFDSTALLDGDVDAISGYSSNEPFLYHQEGLPISILNPMSYGVDFYGDMLFTREDVMRNRPDVAERFRRATLKGWVYALDHKEEVIHLLRNRFGARKSLEHLRFEAAEIEKAIQPKNFAIGEFNLNRLRWIADFFKSADLASEQSDLSGLDYRDYLNKGPEVRIWAFWMIGIMAAFMLASLFQFALNRRLQNAVDRRTRDLAKIRDRLQYYMDVVDKYVIFASIDTAGTITHASRALARITDHPVDELLGHDIDKLRHPDQPPSVFEGIWKTLDSGVPWHGELRLRTRAGSTVWVDAHIEPRFDENGRINGFTSVETDITDKKRIEELSVTDQLTGLFNRTRLDEALARAVGRVHRYGRPVSVILLDADDFKSINDAHGHGVGDKVLVALAALLRDNVRASDVAGRWGGEEFMVICPETPLEGAAVIAEKLRRAIADHGFPVIGHMTASFGVAASCPGNHAEDLFARADKALYRAKDEGRNRVCVDPDG